MATRVYHNLDDLESDLRKITRAFKAEAAKEVRDVAQDGTKMARRLARRSAGKHGKHYFRSITAGRAVDVSAGVRGGPLVWEFGPDISKPQGGMSFERGSRNQPPHHDLAQAADVYGADDLAIRIRNRVFHDLFWPT